MNRGLAKLYHFNVKFVDVLHTPPSQTVLAYIDDIGHVKVQMFRKTRNSILKHAHGEPCVFRIEFGICLHARLCEAQYSSSYPLAPGNEFGIAASEAVRLSFCRRRLAFDDGANVDCIGHDVFVVFVRVV